MERRRDLAVEVGLGKEGGQEARGTIGNTGYQRISETKRWTKSLGKNIYKGVFIQ